MTKAIGSKLATVAAIFLAFSAQSIAGTQDSSKGVLKIKCRVLVTDSKHCLDDMCKGTETLVLDDFEQSKGFTAVFERGDFGKENEVEYHSGYFFTLHKSFGSAAHQLEVQIRNGKDFNLDRSVETRILVDAKPGQKFSVKQKIPSDSAYTPVHELHCEIIE